MLHVYFSAYNVSSTFWTTHRYVKTCTIEQHTRVHVYLGTRYTWVLYINVHINKFLTVELLLLRRLQLASCSTLCTPTDTALRIPCTAGPGPDTNHPVTQSSWFADLFTLVSSNTLHSRDPVQTATAFQVNETEVVSYAPNIQSPIRTWAVEI